MLRRILLAASDSGRVRQLVTSAPVARGVVARYVAGDAAADAVAVAGQLREAGLLVSLDHLGEDTRDARQADAATGAYTALLASLESAGLTAGAATEVSVKPTAVGLGLADHGEKTATENISRICTAARAAGTTVTVDMEDHSHVDATLRIVRAVRGEFPDLGCVIQSYLRRSPEDCQALAVAGSRVRLCKGAYSAAPGVAFAARAAQRGAHSVGIVNSSTHDPLRPGYYAVYSGLFATRPAAGRAAARVHRLGYTTAYVRQLFR